MEYATPLSSGRVRPSTFFYFDLRLYRSQAYVFGNLGCCIGLAFLVAAVVNHHWRAG